MPFQQLQLWLDEEKIQGAPNPQHAVLATVNSAGGAHSRVIYIREITTKDLLFFSQSGTTKVQDLRNNSYASMTFWFELLQRSVVVDGHVTELSFEEKQVYWQQMPKDRQLKFSAYAPLSAQPIKNIDILENQREKLKQQYPNDLPICNEYCGFRFYPKRFVFYSLSLTDDFSHVIEYKCNQDAMWYTQLLSP